MHSPLAGLAAAAALLTAGLQPAAAQISAVAGGTSASAPRAPYLGEVATRAQVPATFNTSNKQLMMRTIHYARDNITGLQVQFANFYVDAGTGKELGCGAPMTIRASVEYPLGTTPKQLLFASSSTGTIADVSMLKSDPLAIAMPNGAVFAIRSWQSSTACIIFNAEWPSMPTTAPGGGDMAAFAATTPDLTGVATTFAAAGVVGYPPVAILGMTQRPVFILGIDSRVAGIKDTGDVSGDQGEFARAIGGQYAYINIARGQVQVQQFVAAGNAVNRIALAQLGTHVLWNGSANDIQSGSRTPSQLVADNNTAMGLLGNKPCWPATLVPYTNGSNVAASQEANRTAYNDLVRGGGVTACAGFIELADVFEARNAGSWTRLSETLEGIHENRRGNLAIAAKGAVGGAVGPVQ